MASLKINTGIKVYDIEDEHGEVRGQIKINTSDLNLFYRASETKEKILRLIEEVKSNTDDTSEESIVRAMHECDLAIKKEINVLFDDVNASDIVFGNQSCLNTLDGITFVERFLNMILPVIAEDLQEEMRKSNERVKQYTSQVK